MDTLIHLVYASSAARPFDRPELLALLDKARDTNGRLDVTGMLLYEDGNFFQVLEGLENVVVPLFWKISADKRHRKTVKIIQEPIAERSFGAWTMAFSAITRQELNDIEGLNDFFGQGSVFSQLGSGRAKKLLAAFRDGRWRSKITRTAGMATA